MRHATPLHTDTVTDPAPHSTEFEAARVHPSPSPWYGQHVRIVPRAGRDLFDRVLAGRTGVVESIELDLDGAVHVIVSLDDDRGPESPVANPAGHRFFFAADEIEPLDS